MNILRFPSATNTMDDYLRQERRKRLRSVILAAVAATAILIGALWVTGCRGSLQPGGAYSPSVTNVVNGVTNIVSIPDKPFAIVEASYWAAYSITDAAFNYERENRLLLWSLDHRIKHTLDEWRPKALEARRVYHVARQAYLANPTPAGLDTLRSIVGQLTQASNAINAVLPK